MRKILFFCAIIVFLIYIILTSKTLEVRYVGDSDPKANEQGLSTVYEWHWENFGNYFRRFYVKFIRRIIIGEPLLKK